MRLARAVDDSLCTRHFERARRARRAVRSSSRDGGVPRRRHTALTAYAQGVYGPGVPVGNTQIPRQVVAHSSQPLASWYALLNLAKLSVRRVSQRAARVRRKWRSQHSLGSLACSTCSL